VLVIPSILVFSFGTSVIMAKAYVASVYVRLMVVNLLVYSSGTVLKYFVIIILRNHSDGRND